VITFLSKVFIFFFHLYLGDNMNLIFIGFLFIFVWVAISFRKIKHKIFALLFISMLLLAYLSFNYAVDYDKVDVSSLKNAGKIYVNYLSLVVGNFFTITGYVVNLDWSLNSSVENLNITD
jgi:hypothetical protein